MADSNPRCHPDLSYLTNSSVHYDEDTEQFTRSQEVSHILFLCGRWKDNAKELLDIFRLLVIRLLQMISSLLTLVADQGFKGFLLDLFVLGSNALFWVCS